MTLIRWEFYDTYTTDTAVFEINPNDDGTPDRKKNLVTQVATAPDGVVILTEGRDGVKEGTFSGTLLTQSQYDMFVTWFNKRYPIRLTDDLSRQFIIYIKDFNAKRVRAFHYPYKHTYTVNYVVIQEL